MSQLRRGAESVAEWNRLRRDDGEIPGFYWRSHIQVVDGLRSNPSLAYVNLSGADLSGIDLSHIDLFEAKLSGADLSGANLSKCRFTRADLSGTNLSGAHLTSSDFYGADFSDSTLQGANISCSDFRYASFARADLTNASVNSTIFESDLSSTIGLEKCKRTVGPCLLGVQTFAFGNLPVLFLRDCCGYSDRTIRSVRLMQIAPRPNDQTWLRLVKEIRDGD